MNPVRRVFLKRLSPALVGFGLVCGYLQRNDEGQIRRWIVERGVDSGQVVFRSGEIFVGEGGPFVGEDGPATRAWNFAWRSAPWIVAAGAGFTGAGAVYVLCAWPLGRTRIFGYRGPTLCGWCGYHLSGLRQPRCPECGRAI